MREKNKKQSFVEVSPGSASSTSPLKRKLCRASTSGFTLVEVLTVIMIIAILASVVLVSLERARERTRDSTIKNQMSQLRSLAETVYTFTDGYEKFYEMTDEDSPDPDYLTVKDKIEEMEGELTVRFTDPDNNDFSSYCAYTPLVSGEDNYFCVDSAGDAAEIDGTEYDFNCKDGDEINCRTEATENDNGNDNGDNDNNNDNGFE